MGTAVLWGLVGGSSLILGAFLVMLADTMMPEAFELRRNIAGLYTVLGFAVSAALALLYGCIKVIEVFESFAYSGLDCS